jgi:two-component system response regulator PilR (NtrC family)
VKRETRKIRILVVDDEEGMCGLLKSILSGEGYSVKTVTSPLRALALLEKDQFDIIFSDIKMPEMDGIDFLKAVLEKKDDQAVIMITAYGSISNAVEAIRVGALDYISKPFQSDEITHAASRLVERINLIHENKLLRNELDIVLNLNSGVVGKSRVIMESIAFARKIADSQLNVLLTGESGTGKEVFAFLLHKESSRNNNPFIPVQCGLIPVNLMESELFGHKRGSFTGALTDKKGLIEEAEGGTVFLDEIGDISTDIQAKLLRFLQEKEIRKVGDTKSRIIDVRFISATNKKLETMVQEKSFREDLFYRLKTVEIHLPPLRNRKEDIPLLIEHFLKGYNETHGRSIAVDNDCFGFLLSYNWPGNIRELRNFVETAATICAKGIIRMTDVQYILNNKHNDYSGVVSFAEMKKRFIKDFECGYLTRILEKTKGNITAAAREAGMDKKNFWTLCQKYSIDAAIFKKK